VKLWEVDCSVVAWQRKEVEHDVKALGRNLILILSGLNQGRFNFGRAA
jgi:hypothetical protein